MLFLHESHTHPGFPPVSGVTSGSFPIPTSGHDFSGNTAYQVVLTVTDSDGLQNSTAVTVVPEKVNLTFTSSPPGRVITIDGIPRTTPYVHDSLVNFTHTIAAPDQSAGGSSYTFASWSDGGAQSHNITVPATDRAYAATFNASRAVTAPRRLRVQRGERHDLPGHLRQRQHAHVDQHHVDDQRPLLQRPVVQRDELRARTASTLDLGSQFTIEAWVLNPANTAFETIASVGSNRDLYLGNGTLGFWNGTSDVTFGAALPVNTWTHVALTSDGAALRAYVNGVQQGATQNVALPAVSGQLQVGAWITGASNADFLGGTIDEVRVYNRALAAAEIQVDMVTPVSPPPPDTIAPTVALTAPAAGATVSGSVNVTATASDNVAVVGVQFLLDGVNLGAEDTTAPYSVAWNTVGATNGTHTLTARARDAVANTTTSAARTVTVTNAARHRPGRGLRLRRRQRRHRRRRQRSANNGTVSGAVWAPGRYGRGVALRRHRRPRHRGRRRIARPHHGHDAGGVGQPGGRAQQLAQHRGQGTHHQQHDVPAGGQLQHQRARHPRLHQQRGAHPGGWHPVDRGHVGAPGRHVRRGHAAPLRQRRPGLQPGPDGHHHRHDERAAHRRQHDHGPVLQRHDRRGSGLQPGSGGGGDPGRHGHAGEPAPPDTVAPVVSGALPTGTLAAGTTSATLQVTTNESATCRYATTAGTAYAQMATTFATTGGTAHSHAVTGLANGQSYTFYVRCQDPAGNATTADTVVSFAVANPPAPDTIAPTVALTAPAAGATVSGSVNVTANASDNVAVVGVQFLLDGANLGVEDTTAPYSVAWNTVAATNGSHTLDGPGPRRGGQHHHVGGAHGHRRPTLAATGLVAAYAFDEGSRHHRRRRIAERGQRHGHQPHLDAQRSVRRRHHLQRDVDAGDPQLGPDLARRLHDRSLGPQPCQHRLRDDRQRRQHPRPLPRQRHHHLLERDVRPHVRRPCRSTPGRTSPSCPPAPTSPST